MENEAFTVPAGSQVRYGYMNRVIVKTVSGAGTCSNGFFGSDPAAGAGKYCEVQKTVPGVTQVAGVMPVINTALIPSPAVAYTTQRVRQLTATELTYPVYQPAPSATGSFRLLCNTSHMSFDDPIVFPGQPGAAHLHIFFGNAGANAASTTESLASTGGSTCQGGTLNRTAYWTPALIDTRTGQPVTPIGTNFYYKLGYFGVKAGTVQPFPKGLRMIAGNSKGTTPLTAFGLVAQCFSGGGNQHQIPSCAVGDSMELTVNFPQCWDGVNLDSPDHKSHMAYGTGSGCPSTHPVPLPEITMNVLYAVTEANTGTFWKLSSDNYAGPGGYSLHADWFGGWDAATNKEWLDNCVNGNLDGHDSLLCNGRMIY